MTTNSSLALHQIHALLGADATDDALWRDLRMFEAAAVPLIDSIWRLDDLQPQEYWRILHYHNDAARALHQERCAEAARQLHAALGTEGTSRSAAACLLHPQLWQSTYFQGRAYIANDRNRARAHLLDAVARSCLAQSTPPDWTARLCRRLVTLCVAANPATTPNVATCVGYLLAHADSATAPLLDALTVGDWSGAWETILTLANQPGDLALSPAPDDGPALVRQGPEQLMRLWQESGVYHAVALLERLARDGRLDAPSFRRLLEALPNALRTVNAALRQQATQPSSAPETTTFWQTLHRLTDTVLWEMLCDFRPETLPVLQHIQFLRGGHYLLRIGEELARQGITGLHVRRAVDQRAATLSRLLSVLTRRDDDESAALIPLLRQLGTPTLLALLPHARPYEAEICAALDWDGSVALVALLHRLEAGNPARSADPAVGVVWRQEIVDRVALLADEHARALLDAFAATHPGAVTLVRAALGWNRVEVRRLLGRRNQLAARAVALLPLDRPAELLQRYQLLARYAQDATSSPAGRKAYERAAAQAGLTNLALHAGYADATRLEWAMEDQLGAERVRLGRQWEIEGYTLTLALRDDKPAIEVRNHARLLKRTPTAVARDYAYREVRTTLEQAQDQQRRYRQAFLDSMRNGQPIRAEELALLRRNPLAAALLERLVLLDEAGAVGLFRGEDGALEGSHGERVRISGAVTIPHPCALAEQGLLEDWQAAIVARQIVQPFKQVFRELYVVTPAELAARYESGRLAGRRMKGRQALAVLANLGWVIDGYGAVQKPFYDLGYAARFAFGGFDDEGADDGATTGAVSFWPLKPTAAPRRGEPRIPLADVPALIFSEVLRDLDLVTVIAHQSAEEGASREVLRRRGDLVRALAGALSLDQVQVAEPVVTVRGERASYRIHLATAAIYLDSGQYLCIVPSPKERKATYLPFEDGGEPVTSELISKVILLANDTRIADPTILAQLAPLKLAA